VTPATSIIFHENVHKIIASLSSEKRGELRDLLMSSDYYHVVKTEIGDLTMIDRLLADELIANHFSFIYHLSRVILSEDYTVEGYADLLGADVVGATVVTVLGLDR